MVCGLRGSLQIEKGALRYGKYDEYDGHVTVKWWHASCVRVQDPAQVFGFVPSLLYDSIFRVLGGAGRMGRRDLIRHRFKPIST